MTTKLRPIRICGGGLAGLSLGIGLRKNGVPVFIEEAGNYPRHRVCGEFISGVSDEHLDCLGILDLLNQSVPLTQSSWFDPAGRVASQTLPMPARGVSRFRLDQILVERFSGLGGDLKCGHRSSLSEADQPGVVWSAGRKRVSGRRWLGLKIHLKEPRLEDDLEMHLGHGGYLGISRIEDGRANACGLFLTDPELKGNRSELLFNYLRQVGLANLADRMLSSAPDEASFSAVAGFELGRQPEDDGVFELGDAHSMIPPFTGNGMSMAFEGAALSLPELIRYSRGDQSWIAAKAATAIKLENHFRDRLRLATGMHRFLLGGIGQKLTLAMAKRELLPFDWLFERLRTA